MRRLAYILLFFCLGLIPWLVEPAWATESNQLSIQPPVLDIGTFYSGGQVTISGELADGQDVIVEIEGPAVNGQFDIKGRVGPFWMTKDKAEMDGAPSLYVLLLPDGQGWEQKASSLGLGLDKLREKISITSETLPPDDIFNMFLTLKKNEGLYVEKNSTVTYASLADGRKRFTTIYRFPTSTKVGEYIIKATSVENGAKVMEQSSKFPVDEVGFTRLVDDLATNQRLLYGILAVVIALFAGAVMGVLFKGGGGH